MDGSGSEEFRDVREEIVAERGDLGFNTDLMRGRLDDGRPTGIRVMDWSHEAGIYAGVVKDDKRAVIGQGLSPDQARDLAAALEAAADHVEEVQREDATEDDPSPSGIVDRLLDWGESA